MFKTILIPVLVASCALYTRAWGAPAYTATAGDSRQNFEAFEAEASNIHRSAESGSYFWNAPEEPTLVTTSVKDEDGTNKYLYVSASEVPSESLVRTFLPQSGWTELETNAWTTVSGGYAALYCRFRTKFDLYDADSRPECDDEDRLVLWARKDAEDEDAPGEFFVSAAKFEGDVRNPVRYDYSVVTTNVDPEAWHEVTVRTIPDIAGGLKALAFQLWIDGNPVEAAAEDYPVIAALSDLSMLSAEARALIARRRLFPALTAPGLNESVSLGGVGFSGVGVIDDIVMTTNAPAAYAEVPRVFTLRWDAGVASLKYIIAAGATNEVSAINGRCAYFEIPSEATEIEVIATYDTAGDYSQGIWTAGGACSVVTNVEGSVTNYSFRCDASSDPGLGYVRSFRREIGLGGGFGAYASFTEAKEQAFAQGGLPIVLNSDFAASYDTDDGGLILINAGETVTIDLNGHSITNATGEYPTIMNLGRLTIIDSQGGGRVVSHSEYTGDTNDCRQTAVHNYASKHGRPELTIRGGIYDGCINTSGEAVSNNTVRLSGTLAIARSGYDQTAPAFRDPVGEEFVWEDKLVDPTLYYLYDEPYWKPFTNAYIWCGKGADDKWSTPENWRCNEVPTNGCYAIFPPTAGAWEADMGSGVEVKDVWFAGDVVLHGANDCTDCRWTTPSDGRLRGDATLSWNGKLPGDLSTLLDPLWAGTVQIADVGDKSPKLLSALATWGTSASTVVLKGVRGYYQITGNITLPYALKLVNGANGYAWKNDAGFTGGVIEFAALSGDGAFLSPKNTIANRQLIIFRDILSYTGKLEVKGKRVLLGPGDAETTEAGSITWSDGLVMNQPKSVHDCRVAAFGARIDVNYGALGDVLAAYSATEGSVVGYTSTVVGMPPYSEAGELCITNPVGQVKIGAWSEEAVIVDGVRVVTNELLTANSLTSIKAVKAASALRLSFASHYDAVLTTNGDNSVSVRLALNANAVPVIGASGDESATITFADGMASIVVSGAIEGLWYGLEYKSDLGVEWPAEPYIWSTLDPRDGDKVELIAPAEGPSGFYRVVVTDIKPGEGGDE